MVDVHPPTTARHLRVHLIHEYPGTACPNRNEQVPLPLRARPSPFSASTSDTDLSYPVDVCTEPRLVVSARRFRNHFLAALQLLLGEVPVYFALRVALSRTCVRRGSSSHRKGLWGVGTCTRSASSGVSTACGWFSVEALPLGCPLCENRSERDQHVASSHSESHNVRPRITHGVGKCAVSSLGEKHPVPSTVLSAWPTARPPAPVFFFSRSRCERGLLLPWQHGFPSQEHGTLVV